ncbi:zf-HC2 domain-containing protein [Kribbella sandramycini]|uniref:Anti-sigma-K factor RskA n=1 Tax=Kribbella sandramycini TaxID=60450 RepID=A0A7Y4P114_9ACTN|nr:zf-HC2 domain-containing protein [Kribbella sandramycini]MBB6570613.1 anti-sigma-K factor RskA [Kribbella sandramycini]NOL43757.1 zf-HC2 domain-containing protein [Kribbella sandramycini]
MSEHSQLGAYALGALDADEAREVEAHLADCAECRAELVELEELKEFLGEVPPEAFLDGPPEGGDLLLQRTVREVREAAAAPSAVATPVAPVAKKRGRWLLVAAAVVVVAGALGGGVLIGRQTVEQADGPVPGSVQVSATDAASGATMATTVEPRENWTWIRVRITGLKPGAECEMYVTDKAGKVWTAGSWVVTEQAAREGSRFGGGVLISPDQVKSVEIKTVQGAHVVTTTI